MVGLPPRYPTLHLSMGMTNYNIGLNSELTVTCENLLLLQLHSLFSCLAYTFINIYLALVADSAFCVYSSVYSLMMNKVCINWMDG